MMDGILWRGHAQPMSKMISLIVMFFTFLDLTLATDYQQGNIDNVYQREHSLVKPYQGSGMVSSQP